MTFVCGICKARYQIPDRRLDGRTTMMCRDCQQPMRVSRESISATWSGRPSAVPPKAPSEVPVPIDVHAPLPAGISSALGVEIIQIGQPARGFDAPEVNGASPPPLDEWHIGLRDTAVGPLRCEEIGRMLVAGTLTLDSLAWRRGFGSWLPIRQIPELAPEKPAPPGLPCVPSERIPSSMPPCPPAGLRVPTLWPAPGERTPRARAVRLRSSAPPRHSVGPAPGRASSAARSAAPRSGSLPGTLGTAFGLALLMTGAAITGARFWDAQTQSIVRPLPVVPTQRLIARTVSEARRDTGPDSLPVAVRPRPEPSLVELPVGRAAENVQLPGERDGEDRSSHAPGRGRHSPAHGQGPRAAMPRRARDRQVEAAIEPGASAGLSAEQLSRVVLRGGVKLQRCYEVALRGTASDDALRTQIGITVAASGGVVNVETRGQALPGMTRCIERAVRKWRFPAATESTHTEFPVVFQPGSPSPTRP